MRPGFPVHTNPDFLVKHEFGRRDLNTKAGNILRIALRAIPAYADTPYAGFYGGTFGAVSGCQPGPTITLTATVNGLKVRVLTLSSPRKQYVD